MVGALRGNIEMAEEESMIFEIEDLIFPCHPRTEKNA